MKIWGSAALGVLLALQAREPQIAPFRAAANAVVLDVSVVDDRNRPILGLTADDFTILEGGRERPVVAFDAVNVSSRVTVPASWPTADVVTNEDALSGRVIAIFMDDATPMPQENGGTAKAAARALIDRMGPLDRAAVVFAAARGSNQDFTMDRARLHAAVERFKPRPDLGSTDRRIGDTRSAPNDFTHFDPTASTLYLQMLKTLRMLAEGLGGLSIGRKSIVLISVGLPIEIRERAGSVAADEGEDPEFAITPIDSLPDPSQQKELLKHEMLETIRSAGRSFVRIYTIDPGALRAPLSAAGSDEFNIGVGNRVFLQSLSKVTGGFAVIGTNDVAGRIPAILGDTGAYYILGYQSAGRGGVQVKVNRPGAIVNVRQPAKVTGPPGTDIAAALNSLLPVSELSMQLTAAPFAIPGGQRSALAVVVGFRQNGPAAGPALNESVEVVVSAYDTSGKSVASKTTTVTAGLPAGGANIRFEVLSRLDVKPGRYQVRVAALASPDKSLGSVFTDVDVPDYSAPGVAMSGLLFTATPGRLATPRNALQSLTAAIPTAQREFETAQTVAALVTVYKPAGRLAGDVEMITEVRNGSEGVAFGSRDLITAREFDPSRAKEFRVEIPVKTLAPGPYLLSIEAAPRASADPRNHARVQVPFSVR